MAKILNAIELLQKYMKISSWKEEKDLNWEQDKNVAMRYSAQ